MKLIRPVMPDIDDIAPYLKQSYRENQFTNNGPCVRLLEERITDRMAPFARTAICTASGTSGLIAALNATNSILGTVLFPEFTFPATVQAIYNANKIPERVRCLPDTLEMDPEDLDRKLRRGASYIDAVIHVRAFGFIRNLSDIIDVCERYGKPLIVDAAAAFGGSYRNGAPVGDAGVAEVFSCHATKSFGIGEGGIVVADETIEGNVRSNINFGIMEGGGVRYPAINGKMSEFHAAVGLAVLDALHRHVLRRQEIAERFAEKAGDWGSEFNYSPDVIGFPPWNVFPLVLPDIRATRPIIAALNKDGIESRRYYTPLYADQHTPTSLCNRCLCLPCYGDMTDEEADRVISAIDSVFE
jgi:dTDP-4-amino-4,6-dideoxygalactose transaminase